MVTGTKGQCNGSWSKGEILDLVPVREVNIYDRVV